MNNRLIAIGDIHGEIEKLNSLLDNLKPRASDTIIFLGDYIDRGKNSKEVISTLLKLKKKLNCIFLMGNHEDMLLNTKIEKSEQSIETWLLLGGVETMDNYGGYPEIFYTHGDFFKNLRLYHIQDNFLFSHAGINPTKTLDEQTKDDLLWIRDEFIFKKHNLPYKIVFGHTPFKTPLIMEDKIGIDTGCGKIKNGKLCAYICSENKIITS